MSARERARPSGDLFVPVAGARVSSAITQQIRSAILEGKLQPGDRLPNERDLAERFGVSRVTVRDALRTLEAAGLLEIRLGASGGPFVTTPSAQLVGEGISNMLVMSAVQPDQIAEARLILELGTVELVVERATDEEIEELRELVEQGARALEAGEYDSELSREFHAVLARLAHNAAIELVTETFAGPLSMHAVREREPTEVSHRRTVDEHLALVEAIADRDTERAREIMAAHLTRATRVSDGGRRRRPQQRRTSGSGRSR
jgi:GntR family transcriptional repressor for pyruvate dehydrogenase complex